MSFRGSSNSPRSDNSSFYKDETSQIDILKLTCLSREEHRFLSVGVLGLRRYPNYETLGRSRCTYICTLPSYSHRLFQGLPSSCAYFSLLIILFSFSHSNVPPSLLLILCFFTHFYYLVLSLAFGYHRSVLPATNSFNTSSTSF